MISFVPINTREQGMDICGTVCTKQPTRALGIRWFVSIYRTQDNVRLVWASSIGDCCCAQVGSKTSLRAQNRDTYPVGERGSCEEHLREHPPKSVTLYTTFSVVGVIRYG